MLTFKTKIIIFVLIATGVTLFSFNISFAINELDTGPYANHPEIIDLTEKIDNKEQELEKLKAASQAYEVKLEESRKNATNINSEIDLIDNLITKVELDIRTTELTIERSKLKQDSLRFQIDKEQEEIDSQKTQLIEYIKLINKGDQRTMLEILILNDSFAEFFNQVQQVEQVQANIKNSVDRLILLRDALTVQKVNLENYQKDLDQAKSALEEKQLKLKDQSAVKEVLLTETKRSEIKYQKLIEEERQMESEVGNSLSSIKDEIKRKVERLRSGHTDPATTLEMWPVAPSRGISTYFNDPDYPFRHLFEHSAIDIPTAQGTSIKVPADGYVVRARDSGYGYSYITIVHDNGLATVYGHVNKIYVEQDEFVKAGSIIGLSGGRPGSLGAGKLTTGAHLHFEVRLNGVPVDPLKYLP